MTDSNQSSLEKIFLWLNPKDERADDLRNAVTYLREEGIDVTVTSAYSGYTEAEFGRRDVAGADRILEEMAKYLKEIKSQ